MTLWLITDTHWYHRRIVELAKRPEDFNEQMIANWQRLVAPTDTVIHLGDMFLGKDRDFEPLVRQLPGTIILLRGNHDHHSPGWYERHGIHLCCDSIRRGEYLFSHEPVTPLDSETRANIFGHWHGDQHRYADVEDDPFFQSNQHRYWHLHIEGTFAPVRFDDFALSHRSGELERGSDG